MHRVGALALWLLAQAAANSGWETLVQKGVELRLAGHEQAALAVFREAMQTATTPRLLAQMALAEQSIGSWRDAEAHLVQALSSSADPWIVKQHDALREALATIQAHLGSLELRGGDGAHVSVDGQPAGTLPLERPLRLEVGKHRVEIRREGAYPFVRDVEIAGETVSRETVSLTAIEPEPAPPAATVAGPASSPPPPMAPPAPPPAPSPLPRVLGWTFVAGGAAATAFGVAALLASNGRAHDYNDDPTCTGHADEPPSCSDAASASRAWRTGSIASFVTAGALVGAGIVLLVWKVADAPVRIQATPRRGAPSLDLTSTF